MFVVTILPIARGINKNSLTYFSKEEIKIGSIVTVPLRTKDISGIVLECQKAESLRSELRSLPYQLKKIQIESTNSFFSDAFIKAIKDTSVHFASTEGALISSVVPKILFELSSFISENSTLSYTKKKENIFEECAIQNSDKERFDIYKGIIREAFAKKESVFIATPTDESAKKIEKILSRGIENYTVLFLSSLTKKKIKVNVEKILSDPHPLFIIGNYSYTPIMRQDTKTIIVEEESSRFWKQNVRPFADIRFFFHMFAKYFKSKIIYADSLLSVETLWRIREHEVVEYSRIMSRGHKSIPTLVVDMKKKAADEVSQEKVEKEKTEFEVLSPELKEMICYAERHKKNIFLFSTRRGLAPITLCKDCGKTVLCHKCGASVVLHTKKESNNFICHHCGAMRPADTLCAECGSWRLESFGVGIEKIIEEVKKISKSEIFRIDTDTNKTPESIKETLSEFFKNGGVLVGTELVLKYLEESSINYSAIVSFDSLFSLPDFRVEERAMHLIIKIKSIANENFLLQGRNIENKIVEYAVSEDFSNFTKYELEGRETFGYPPFKTLIKITISGKKESVSEEVRKTAEILKEFEPTVFPAFIKTMKDKTIAHILIKIDPKKWPDKSLEQKLLSLPPAYLVKVDPESLL